MSQAPQPAGEASPWNAATIADYSRRLLGRRQLIVAANRAPYARAGKGKRWFRPAGGLASALDRVLQATGGLWVAGVQADSAPTEGTLLPPGKGLYRLEEVALSQEEMRKYYLGYANGALWPLCHLLVERARFNPADWAAYREANARFARTIALQARPGDVIWFHDYHLALAPRLTKQAMPASPVAVFWHIPWPPHDVLLHCPRSQRRALLAGLLGADLLGFQIREYALNFLDCAARELGAAADPARGTITYKGHVTRVQAFPISIDFDHMSTLARAGITSRRIRHLRRSLGLEDRLVGVGVDRLDYTKGIPERLEALELLFEQHPEFREKVTFVQVAVPSRTGLDSYQHLKRRVEDRVAAVNRRFRTKQWRPIKYIGRLMGEESLAALYRLADFAVVSSLYDGMNLVAKEYVACQVERPGILLLSETAGVSRDLKGAVSINPLDPEGMADAVHQALSTPPDQRKRQVAAWQAYLAHNNIYKWAAEVLHSAVRAG